LCESGPLDRLPKLEGPFLLEAWVLEGDFLDAGGLKAKISKKELKFAAM